MQRLVKLGTAVVSIAAIAFTAYAGAIEEVDYNDLGNLENGKNIFMNGKNDVPACKTCHGETGLGDDNMGTPRLASQGFAYLVKQLEDFATDKRTDTTMFIMNTNAKGLSAQDRKDVAAYISSQKLPVEASKIDELKAAGQPVGVRHLGKALAQYGSPERGIPACHSCHGYNGRGAFPVYPRIGGQRYVYIINQLKKWKDSSRANDPLGQMQKVAKHMTEEDMHNVATFLTQAPETTEGNSRVPYQY